MYFLGKIFFRFNLTAQQAEKLFTQKTVHQFCQSCEIWKQYFTYSNQTILIAQNKALRHKNTPTILLKIFWLKKGLDSIHFPKNTYKA